MANDGPRADRIRSVDEPLEFDSYLRPRVWGGQLLGDILGKSLAGQSRIGESWEVSGLPEHPSVVARGTFAGRTLSQLWQDYDLTGAPRADSFPLLVKWLDCTDWLSVQVHPGDELARRLPGRVSGKSEAWVVVHAEPTARVYAGLRPGVTPQEFRAAVDAGSLLDCLHSFVPRVGDCIWLPAGTVHSAGGGVVVAEVQQSSDVTFRLFDWDRAGLEGQPRALQVDMALEAIVWPQGPVAPAIPLPLQSAGGAASELLLRTDTFELERHTVLGRWTQPHSGELTIWMVLEGAAVLDGAGYTPHRILKRGSTILIPAGVTEAAWASADANERCRLLCVRLPPTKS